MMMSVFTYMCVCLLRVKLVPQDLRGHVDPRDHVVRVECQVLLEIQDYKVPLEPTEMREKKGLR